MISNPLSGIRKDVADVVDELIPDGKNGEWSGDSSYHIGHKRRYARTLEILLSSDVGTDVIEIATSDIVSVAISKLVPEVSLTVTNFDLSGATTGTHSFKSGKEKFSFPSYYVDLETTALPADDETFDTIICCEVLEHLDVDPMFMLSEFNRVLKPGGRLLLTTPNITSSHALFKMLRGIEPYFFMQYHKDGSPYRHNYEYSHGALTATLAAAGFAGEIWTENSFEDGVDADSTFLLNAGFKLNTDLLGDNLFASVYKVSDVVDRYPSPIYV